MKLSMLMLVNQLRSFDIETMIKPDAPIELVSARRVYAANCVHVYQLNSDVICSGEGNIIKIFNISVEQAFELIQSIFDLYNEWQATVLEAAMRLDFDTVIKACSRVFHNPTILFNNNFKIVAISRQYNLVDREWRFLLEHGHSSQEMIHFLYNNSEYTLRSSRPDAQYFMFPPGVGKTNTISTQVFSGSKFCGRFSVLEVERPLNSGDMQLLNVLTQYIGVYLEQYNLEHPAESVTLLGLITDEITQAAASEDLERHMAYVGWQHDDPYRIVLLDGREEPDSIIAVNHAQLRRTMPLALHYVCKKSIVSLLNERLYAREIFLKYYDEIVDNNKTELMISLPFTGLKRLSYYYEQVVSGLEYARLFPEEKSTKFDDYAMRYLLENSDGLKQLLACHPIVYALYERGWEEDKDTLRMLSVYLKNNRSLKLSAQALHVHRNTLVYRLKKFTEKAGCDLTDTYTRDYMMLSLMIVELIERRKKENE